MTTLFRRSRLLNNNRIRSVSVDAFANLRKLVEL